MFCPENDGVVKMREVLIGTLNLLYTEGWNDETA